MEPQAELVVLHTYFHRYEAELAQSALEAYEIPSMISGDDLGSEGPGVFSAGGIRLLVRLEDQPRAREILDAPPATDGEPSTEA
jgi:hypothetical protein